MTAYTCTFHSLESFSISCLRLFWISIVSQNILHLASNSFFTFAIFRYLFSEAIHHDITGLICIVVLDLTLRLDDTSQT
jgi:hypothetical protein